MSRKIAIAGKERHLGGWKRVGAVRPLEAEALIVDADAVGGVDPALIPRAQDQGTDGKCVGETVVEVYEGCEKQPPSDQRLYAEDFVYAVGREFEGTPLSQDVGMQVETGFIVAERTGVCLRSTWRAATDQRPNNAAFAEAALHKMLLRLALPNLQSMKDCVDTGFPFAFGTDVSQQLMGDHAAATGMVAFPELDSDWLPEGHAMSAWRRDDTIRIGRSVGAFLCLNHWSERWGFDGGNGGGMLWLPYDYFRSGRAADAHTGRRVAL